MQISELTKNQLLGIIYNCMPNTLYDIHPCYCVMCGKDWVSEWVMVEGRNPTICNECDSRED